MSTLTVEELAFTSLSSEVNDVPLKVTGQMPTWLNGILVRNGPALFEIGKESFHHWFDGQAMLHSYKFKAGEVVYSNKFLDTTNIRAHRKAGKWGLIYYSDKTFHS
jgi:beta,beta-carotene 9',10'-dioxygenase